MNQEGEKTIETVCPEDCAGEKPVWLVEVLIAMQDSIYMDFGLEKETVPAIFSFSKLFCSIDILNDVKTLAIGKKRTEQKLDKLPRYFAINDPINWFISSPKIKTLQRQQQYQLSSDPQEELENQLMNQALDGFVDVSPFTSVPQDEAAKLLGMKASTLSKRWKEATIDRKWPYTHPPMHKWGNCQTENISAIQRKLINWRRTGKVPKQFPIKPLSNMRSMEEILQDWLPKSSTGMN